MNIKMNCQTCTDPTKYVVGFWDGGNGEHGQFFDCDNAACEVKQEMIEKALLIREKTDEVDRINLSNGISMNEIKAKRKELGITINKMALKLRILCSTYSNYEQCREALPIELKGKIEEVFNQSEVRAIMKPNHDGDPALLGKLIGTMRERGREALTIRDGEPCEHSGCLSHLSHPCEGCGRIGGRSKTCHYTERSRL